MKGPLNFRINTSKKRIQDVDFQQGPQLLLLQLSSIIDVPADQIHLFFGFPKRCLNCSSQDKPLRQYKLSPNQLVIVQIKPSTTTTKTTKSTKTTTTTTPPPPPKKQQIKSEDSKSQPESYTQTPDKSGLIMIRRIIPADNSCLFNAISKATLGDFSLGRQYRQLVSQYITNNPTKFSKLQLDKEPEQYAKWILTDSAWGGQPQLFILSNELGVEIVAISVQNLRYHCYGSKQENLGLNRVYVLYDGIHYDLLTKNAYQQASEDSDIRVLPGNDDFALQGAMILAKELNSKSQFTDVTKFSLVCLVCRKPLQGEVEAVRHGKETGHSNFTEIQK